MEDTNPVRYMIARIVGNELPPRDYPGSKLRALHRILQYGPYESCEHLWVINHLFDEHYRKKVIQLLDDHGQRYLELKFDPSAYVALPTPQDRLRYAINVNEARNIAVRYSQRSCEFTVCLDQDCFFTRELWAEVAAGIEADQRISNRRYYGVMMKRITDEGEIASLDGLSNEEPNVIFRHDAERLFDPDIPFGQNDKIELLNALGYGPRPDYLVTGDLCKTMGVVLHLSFGNEHLERDMRSRVLVRRETLPLLLRRLDERYERSEWDFYTYLRAHNALRAGSSTSIP